MLDTGELGERRRADALGRRVGIDELRVRGLEGDETYIVNGILKARPGLPVNPKTREEMAAAAEAQGE